jgi:hypothetical protein
MLRLPADARSKANPSGRSRHAERVRPVGDFHDPVGLLLAFPGVVHRTRAAHPNR